VLSVLSRLLLCLCLLVDTVGPAVAATHLANAMGPAVGTPTPVADEDCHGMPADAVDDAVASMPASPVPVDDECVERCLELCLQHGPATLPAMAPVPHPTTAAPAASGVATRLVPAYALPSLRPPIG
jgi:hypothetical protein